MGRRRAPCCAKEGLKKGTWSAAEDIRLKAYVQEHGHCNWRSLPKHAGLDRCGKSCRLRWFNYLRPGLKRGNFTEDEEETVIKLQGLLGNKWSKIASYLPGRTDNEIKNVWNTHIKKRFVVKESEHLPRNPDEEQPSSLSSVSCDDSSIETPPPLISSPFDMDGEKGLESKGQQYNLSENEVSSGISLSEDWNIHGYDFLIDIPNIPDVSEIWSMINDDDDDDDGDYHNKLASIKDEP